MRVNARVASALGALLVVGVAAGLWRTQASRGPTYREDVAPLLGRHCLSCHGEGPAAISVSLLDYASVARRSALVKSTVANRQMPPWGPDSTGQCGAWRGSRWLSAEEVKTIIEWVDRGAPEGSGPVAPQPQPPPAEAIAVDRTVDIGGEYRPGIGPGGNRCFVVDPGLGEDRLLAAIAVRASDPRGIAQVTVHALDTAAADARAASLDAAEPGAGYPCYGSSSIDGARLVGSWTAGTPPRRIAAQGGLRLRAGRHLILETHFHIGRVGSGYATTLAVDLDLGASRELELLELRATGSLSPVPGTQQVTSSLVLDRAVVVHGVTPRMHEFGKALVITRRQGERRSCLATFDHFMFRFKELAELAEPLRLEAGDALDLSCAYRKPHDPVRFGDAIDEEACVATLLVER